VPNRYPAFVQGTGESSAGENQPQSIDGDVHLSGHPAIGAQEVIIETPRHDLDPATMSVDQIEDVLEVLHARYTVHQGADAKAHTVLFKNRGREAGNSLIHAHAQLYSLRGPVPLIDAREARCRQFYESNGDCVVCSLDRLEPDAVSLRVAENESFVARIPWAPATALEVWIHPRRHVPSFGQLTDPPARRALADILALVLSRYRGRAGDPAYNMIWHGGRLAQADAPHLHWYIQIRPKVARQAGFEMGTDVDLCPSDPVADAALLR